MCVGYAVWERFGFTEREHQRRFVFMVKPHDVFDYVTPDTVAECWKGVMGVPGLYQALWKLVESYDNSYRENIEDIGPADVIGINATSKFWDKLSPEHQIALNRLYDENK
jgi:hypothetical protein